MTERRDITFFGRVQGVGFRYTAIRVAGGYDVTGYVRNMPDGSVQCVVEGEAADIDLFVEDLSSRMDRYIERVTQSKSTATGRYHSFGVEY
jgi:acylphosphatase